MALISIIIGLILDRAFRNVHEIRNLAWFHHFSASIGGFVRVKNGFLSLFLVLLIPVSGVYIIQSGLSDILFDLLSLLFGIAVFLFCLGPACLSSEIDSFLESRRKGDEDAALNYARAITGKEASLATDQQIPDVLHAILFEANERIFSVIFWFVLLGPVGAVVYRLTSEMARPREDKDPDEAASWMSSVLAWIPTRLLAMGYALSGHFDGALNGYHNRSRDADINSSNRDILVSSGLGALHDINGEDELACIHSARNLVMRAIIMWLAVLAALTLAGWMS